MLSGNTGLFHKQQLDRPVSWKPRSIWLLAVVLTLDCYNYANASQWKLEMHNEQYQISIQGKQADRLILSHDGENTRFVLLTAAGQDQPDNRQILQLRFDNETSIIETGLSRLDRRTYLIQLSGMQKNEILKQMINRINLQMRYQVKEHIYREISFSLLGFTAVLNDFLIAHEIGRLDPEWLNENHKMRELMCYYAANFSVLSMLHRKNGLAYKQSLSRLKKRYTDELDEVITDIVRQVYAMPRSSLPHDPRGDKFGIFQRCMERFQQP